jgi:hypothetical protein
MAAGPAWNNWIAAIIPAARFRDFLAVRSRLTQLAAFAAFLAGGAVLTALSDRGRVLTGFALLFAAAGLCRALSSACLALQSEAPEAVAVPPLRFRRVVERFRAPESSRFLLFLLCSTIAVNIGGPFFSPYMLAHVRFTYWQYVALVSAAYVAKIVFYPWVARLVRRLGPYRALWISGICVAPPPLFWFWTPQLGSLILLQVFAGVAWAVFELASTLLVFDRIEPKERLQILTLYNFLSAAAVVAGALLGGWMLARYPEDEAYHYVFAMSASCRLLSLGTLVGLGGIRVKVKDLAWRVTGLRPSQGSLAQPILVGESGEERRAPSRGRDPGRALHGHGRAPAPRESPRGSP